MTRELLEQYSDITAEILELESKVKRSVNDSGFPDGCGSKLFLNSSGADMYINQIEELKKQKLEIEKFVNMLPTSKHRRMVRLKVMDNLSWVEVAGRMGYVYSVDGLRKSYERMIKGTSVNMNR